MVSDRVFAVDKGPTGGPEALVYVHVEDLARGCIYGHVRRAPAGGFAAMLLHSHVFLSAETPLLLFRRFDHWIGRLCRFTPLLCREEGQVFAHLPTAGAALAALVGMVATFSIEERWPADDEARLSLGQDLGVLDIFSVEDLTRGFNPPPPPARLRVVAPAPAGIARGPRPRGRDPLR